MRRLRDRYRLPIIVTENGWEVSIRSWMGQVHDDYRIAYFRRHVEQMRLAVVMAWISAITPGRR